MDEYGNLSNEEKLVIIREENEEKDSVELFVKVSTSNFKFKQTHYVLLSNLDSTYSLFRYGRTTEGYECCRIAEREIYQTFEQRIQRLKHWSNEKWEDTEVTDIMKIVYESEIERLTNAVYMLGGNPYERIEEEDCDCKTNCTGALMSALAKMTAEFAKASALKTSLVCVE